MLIVIEEEESVVINTLGPFVVVKSNDIGFSIDVLSGDELVHSKAIYVEDE